MADAPTNPATAPFRLTMGALWLAIPTILVFVDVGTQAEYQGDLWTHLRQGRLIVESGGIPATDQITYTIYGQPVLNQNWLGQILLYESYLIDGIRSTQFLAAVLYSFVLALVTWVCYKRSGDARCAAAATVIAFACGWTNFSVRTQTFGIGCFAVSATTLWLWPKKAWWPLAVIAVNELFWTNVHGTFPLGIVLPLAFAFGRALDALKEGWTAPLSDDLAQKSLAAAVVAGVVCFACPAPEQILGYLDQNVSRSTQREVMEWLAPTLGELTGIMFFASAVVAMLTLNYSGRKLSRLEAVLLVVFFLLGAKAVRMVIWWGLMVAPILAVQFQAWVASRRAAREAARFADPTLPSEPIESESPVMNWVMAGLLFGFVCVSTPWTKFVNPAVTPARKLTVYQDEPAGGVKALVEKGATGNLLTTLEWGAYASWHVPGIYITMDARLDMFSDAIWADLTTVTGAIPGWENVLERDRVNWILWPTRTGERLMNAVGKSPDWREVFRDGNSVVYERVTHLPDPAPGEIAALIKAQADQARATSAARK